MRSRRRASLAVSWSPLGFGFLTGRYRKDTTPSAVGRVTMRPEWFDPANPVTARKLDAVEQLVVLAKDAGCPLAALATAFPLAHRAVTSVIIGPRTAEQLEDSRPRPHPPAGGGVRA